MITLTRKLKKDASASSSSPSSNGDGSLSKRVSIRDRLLVKEVQEMEQNLPSTCKIFFGDPNVLSEFTLVITPDEGFWKDGKFKFVAVVPEEYNMTVRRGRYIWHPITLNGQQLKLFIYSPTTSSHPKWNAPRSCGIQTSRCRVTYVCLCCARTRSTVWVGRQRDGSRMSSGASIRCSL